MTQGEKIITRGLAIVKRVQATTCDLRIAARLSQIRECVDRAKHGYTERKKARKRLTTDQVTANCALRSAQSYQPVTDSAFVSACLCRRDVLRCGLS